MANQTSIDEFSFDDFTLSSAKKEKQKRKCVVKTFVHKNIQDEAKKITLDKINSLTAVPVPSKEILRTLVEGGKLLEIYETYNVGDNCLTIPAKINLDHESFSHLSSEEIEIKIVPPHIYSFNMNAYSFHNGTKFQNMPCKSKQQSNSNVNKISLKILSINDRVIFLQKKPIGINLTTLLSMQKNCLKRLRIIKELLNLFHEILRESYFWGTRQFFINNFIYHNKRWTIVETTFYNSSYQQSSIEKNFIQIIMMSKSEFLSVLKDKCWKCKCDCIVKRIYEKVLENNFIDFY